ncbi:hypothetical protein A2501_03105 [Candidatus Uhrbacteria bacterium RIFOXYC12_FULL_57_11]|nr:MAG: hypothetical protein A2501_03105 [Candidatus Uhrbacteria bacterium RIFOXYC12_FULL_57_11]
MALFWILVSTFCVSCLSLVGIFVLYLKGKKPGRALMSLVALSTGAMLGNSIFHLLPEAIETGETVGLSLFQTFLIVTGAFVLSFIFEQAFSIHHCHSTSHHGSAKPSHHCHTDIKPFAHLVLWGDLIHNFIDGLIVAAAFIVSPALGLTTVLAVALHEIPQELGDFAVLVYGGYSKRRALLLNYLSATSIIFGGIVGYMLSSSFTTFAPFLLPFAAGSFLYIATSDLLPELKHEENIFEAILHVAVFLLGLGMMIGFALME